jgi:hypothetical protein
MAFEKHCSDELLLAHLDGELSFGAGAVLQRHLKACWDCRTRAAELDRQIQAVAAAVARQTFPGPDRLEAARARLLAGQAEFERKAKSPAAAAKASRLRRPFWPVFAACCLALAAGVSFRQYRTQPETGARALLASVELAEKQTHRLPVYQMFRAEIREVLPERRARVAKLEVWAEPEGRRLAARWHDDSGTLSHAIWHTGDGQSYRYDAGNAGLQAIPDELPPFPAVEISRGALSAEQVEARFLEWIRRRSWRPVAFAEELRVFADERGAELWAERQDGIIRLTARNESGRERVTITVEVESQGYRPRVQTIRFESDTRAIELRLTTQRQEEVPRHLLHPAVFRPSVPAPAGAASLPKSTPPRAATILPEPPASTAAEEELAELEMEAQYVLHRAGACLEGAIQIERSGDRIRVRGLVADTDRKRQLLEGLAEIRPAALSVDIKTIEEASTQPRSAGPIREEPAAAGFREVPLENRLNQHFEGDGARIARFSTEVVSAADGSLSHAWALRRLMERYGGTAVQPVHAPGSWLLETMIRDHEGAIGDSVRSLRTLLMPLLQPQAEGARPDPLAPPDFDAIQLSNRLIHGLFAGADLAGLPAEAAASELWRALSEVERSPRSASIFTDVR